MKKTAALISVLLVVSFFVFRPFVIKVFSGFSGGYTQLASVFFAESSKPEVLKQVSADAETTGHKVRILIVPGHDAQFSGTSFADISEADLNLQLGKQLATLLSKDSKYEVILARNYSGYNPALEAYFSSKEQSIVDFVKNKKQIMYDLVSEGKVVLKTNGVHHNIAPRLVVVRLYGINKWANENKIDLVVHIHFNDYSRKDSSLPGKYSGFAIYTPEKQYSNSRASDAVATEVSKQLKTHYPESNMPKEDTGVVEDQDLIAIGSFNTLDPASMLIEYAYIYEPQLQDVDIRNKIITDMATQTYLGIRNFFDDNTPSFAGKFNTPLLPYHWQSVVTKGTQYDDSVLSLQTALSPEGLYPPKPLDLHECPLSGTYGRCTSAAISLFQQKYDLPNTSGLLDSQTLAAFEKLYGS